jgi:hypothetical protein
VPIFLSQNMRWLKRFRCVLGDLVDKLYKSSIGEVLRTHVVKKGNVVDRVNFWCGAWENAQKDREADAPRKEGCRGGPDLMRVGPFIM